MYLLYINMKNPKQCGILEKFRNWRIATNGDESQLVIAMNCNQNHDVVNNIMICRDSSHFFAILVQFILFCYNSMSLYIFHLYTNYNFFFMHVVGQGS